MFENEKFEQKVTGQADAIDRYNLRTTTGNKISTKQFSKDYKIWEKTKQGSGAAAESPKKEAKKQGSGAAAKSPVKKGGKQVSKKAGKK